MSVVGRVPVAVSCSEKLTLSLKNGEKASVVLKGAALGKESDVRAAVTVERCHPDRWKGREGMAAVIRVKIPCLGESRSGSFLRRTDSRLMFPNFTRRSMAATASITGCKTSG